jgi:DNA polymerase III subunit delta
MQLRAERFASQLQSEPLKPAYLIAGDCPLRVLEAADALRAKAKQEGYSEREVIDADANFDWDQLDAALANLSLFASRRLFDVRLPKGKPGKDGSEAIQRYCSNPAPDTVLMITCQEWSKQHEGKWSDAIANAGHSLIVWPLKSHELPDWLRSRLRSRGLSATPAAIDLLADRVEGNLLAAAQEIDKLALLAPNSTLDEQQLMHLVADASRYDVFRLIDCALSGDAPRVQHVLAGLRAEGEQVAGLLPMIAKEVLLVTQLAEGVSRGGNLMQEMRSARVWESKQAMYKRAIDRHPASRWEFFVSLVGECDRIAKGRASGDAWLSLERLLLSVAEPKARRLLMV